MVNKYFIDKNSNTLYKAIDYNPEQGTLLLVAINKKGLLVLDEYSATSHLQQIENIDEDLIDLLYRN